MPHPPIDVGYKSYEKITVGEFQDFSSWNALLILPMFFVLLFAYLWLVFDRGLNVVLKVAELWYWRAAGEGKAVPGRIV